MKENKFEQENHFPRETVLSDSEIKVEVKAKVLLENLDVKKAA